MEKLLKNLSNPPKEYRGIPFWSWNDQLNPEILKWQIREMEKAGLGGYFMHARGGLQTKYLGPEWMECITVCVQEGNSLGMKSWCYDEEGWPSGFAGGLVIKLGEHFQVRWLEMERYRPNINYATPDVLGCYLFDRRTKIISLVNPEAMPCRPESYRTFVIKQKTSPYYIDTLNREAIKAFIECTYEKYYRTFQEHFGNGITGFFTDEPQYSRSKIPWSIILPEEFQKRFNYDLREKLPALFIECEGYRKIRYDFWSMVNELFTSAFGEQIYNWCEAHHCRLTGHVTNEDGIFKQMEATAGGMPFYEYFHIPGIDWLGRSISSPVIPKQVSSAACQLGKKFVLTETFGLCGWDASFEELKWIAEWQYVNGVNLMCQHLEGYSLRGMRKRDYPPSLFYQQSWWSEYKLFNDYFARLSVLLTSGKCVVPVLLLHPMKSGWITYNGKNNSYLKKLDAEFVLATETLADLHLDFHYGDETIIRKYGRMEGADLVVGQCRYRAVVIPSMLTIDSYTAELLEQFLMKGGAVLRIGRFPFFQEGVPGSKLKFLKSRIPRAENKSKLQDLVKKLGIATISISGNGSEIGSIRYQQRDLGKSQLFFLVNHDQKQIHNATITIPGKGKVRKIMVETGEIVEFPSTNIINDTRVELSFLPMQSHVLIAEPGEVKKNQVPEAPYLTFQPGPGWEIEEVDLNSLTLDYCSYSIDHGEWRGPVPVIKLMEILLKLRKECDVALKFHFEITMDLTKNKEFWLVLETAAEFEMEINKKHLSYQDWGWWKDYSFKKVNIKPLLRTGSNEIILKRRFHQDQKVYEVLFGENVLETEINRLAYNVELESIYLVGDFGVFSQSEYSNGERRAVFTNGPFVITDRPQMIKTGDLTPQGFCFFAGAITLSQEIPIRKDEGFRLILDFGKIYAGVAKVMINHRLVKTLPWAPYTADITDFVTEGPNRLSVQLFAGNRNLLGPHHHINGEVYSVGTTSFTDKSGWAEGEPGLDIWRESYCFVQFGFGGETPGL